MTSQWWYIKVQRADRGGVCLEKTQFIIIELFELAAVVCIAFQLHLNPVNCRCLPLLKVAAKSIKSFTKLMHKLMRCFFLFCALAITVTNGRCLIGLLLLGRLCCSNLLFGLVQPWLFTVLTHKIVLKRQRQPLVGWLKNLT